MKPHELDAIERAAVEVSPDIPGSLERLAELAPQIEALVSAYREARRDAERLEECRSAIYDAARSLEGAPL